MSLQLGGKKLLEPSYSRDASERGPVHKFDFQYCFVLRETYGKYGLSYCTQCRPAAMVSEMFMFDLIRISCSILHEHTSYILDRVAE